MKVRKDFSVGVVPVYKIAPGVFAFCIVRHAAGHWAFPKGHSEPGETEQETALRELHEETGITDINLYASQAFIETYSFMRGDVQYDKHVTYFVGETDSMQSETLEAFKSEVTEVAWLPYEKAKGTLTFPEAKRLLEEVCEYLESGCIA